jgi:TIR domain-containing protein
MTETEEHQNEVQEFKYWAFISYSHHDEPWAKWLHKSLETYSVPRSLVGRSTRKHGELPKRIFPVFRDRDELPGAADLGGKIKNALRQSRNLIVICSTKSSNSKWVNEEIKTYKAMGRDDRVLCLIINGEPNASDSPASGLHECFPQAVRFRVEANGEISTERAEPIAADVRKGKDGRPNAKLKLLAGVLDVGYDELRQRERRRKLRRQVRNIVGAVLLTLFTIVGYLALADAGLALPGRGAIQTLFDRNDISVMRHAHSLEEIRKQATPIRRTLVDALEKGRTADGWIKTNLNPTQDRWVEVWSHSQSLCGILKSPEVSDEEARTLVNGLDLPFSAGVAIEKDGVKFGWQSHKGEAETIAEPALWTAAALAAALERPGFLKGEERRRYEGHLFYTQEVLRLYRPLETGGWNMFPQQKEPELHNPYTTALALLALLETRKAGLPWDGSTERRDQLLKATAQWLISKFDDQARAEGKPPGWHGVSESANQIFDGLTLQIYAELLRAEAEAGIELPPQILEQIPIHLISCTERDLNFPVASGEFSASMTDHTNRETVGKESVGFLWYPWAIDAATRWLERAEKRGAPREERVRVRRALGHLVVDLGQDAANKARTDWTFIGAELLYGISAVATPESR